MSSEKPEWLERWGRWREAGYDGIKGVPPGWVPAPQIKRFNSARLDLFHTIEQERATYSEIKSRFNDLAEKKNHAIVLALLQDNKPYDESLSFLVHLYKAVSLGEMEGLRLLAGDDAVRGFLLRTGHKHRKSNQTKQIVQTKAKTLWEENPTATISEIERHRDLAEFKNIYKGKNTLRNWIKDLAPSHKRGRPTKMKK